MLKIGEVLDGLALGHRAIDIKQMLKNAGYVVPQSSAMGLNKLPAEVQIQIEAIEKMREQYETLPKSTVFICKICGAYNSSMWRRDKIIGTEFIVCGACDRIAEVR